MFEVTGHRGARALSPENILAGFRLAADLGCAAVIENQPFEVMIESRNVLDAFR